MGIPMSLGEALPKEMARVRDEVMPAYLSIGLPGSYALASMRMELDRAAKAMAEGDVAAMARCLASLKGFRA